MKLQSYLIIGCGRFGSRAAKEILRKNPYSKITVVDKSSRALRRVSTLQVETIKGDGRSYLNQLLSEGLSADYIIPAVPFHLAFEFILLRLRALGPRREKVPPLPKLPNPIAGKTGDLYTSFADFLCPVDCPEPPRHCTLTKKRRPKPLYQLLMETSPFSSASTGKDPSFPSPSMEEASSLPSPLMGEGEDGGKFLSEVIRSEQLGPGVGGFRVEELLTLTKEIEERVTSRQSGLILVSTACRCHGVTSALSWKRTD